MHVHSLRVHPYYIRFIGDFSMKTWLYYLKNKDEAFDMFKDINTSIENKRRTKIKDVMFDNGGEYTSNKFIYFCK